MHARDRAVRYALVAACALALVGRGQAAVEYTPVQLDSPSFAFAFGINGHGQVVGRAALPSGETHAVLWDQGRLVDLGTLPGGTYSEALAINDAGQIVGWSTNDQSTCTAFDGCWHAVLWENGTISDLGGLDPRFQSYAYSVSNRGQISGTSATADYPFGFFRAVTWWRGAQIDLGLPDGATDAFANGINGSGDAAGAAAIGGRNVPVLWSSEGIRELPTPAGEGEARKINDRGQIVGRGANRALLWTDGELIVLPTPAGTSHAEAYDINDRGLIVGDSRRIGGGAVAVRWVQGTVGALPTLAGWTESHARGVNARGDVAGAANTTNGNRAVVWLR